MSFFILFIVGAVLIGAGSMLAPAWPTTQPRIGTAAAFALALVVGGAVFWAFLFGWSTLVVDYLLFALVSIVILGGTMAQAQQRAGSDAEAIDDADVGWPGPEDLVFFALVALFFALPVGLLLFPAGAYAAGNGLVTLAARDGGSFDTLAPYYSGTVGLFPPGFHAFAAYLSAQLQQPIPQIHMAIAAVTALLSIWAAYDLGAEIHDKRLGRTMACAALLTSGIIKLYFNGFYPQLMGVVFALAFTTYALRVVRQHRLLDMVAAGLMIGAVLFVSPMMFVATFAAYALFLLANYLPKPIEKSVPQQQAPLFAHLGRWLLVPLVALFGTLPWLIHIPDVLHILRNQMWWIAGVERIPREPLLVLVDLVWIPVLLVGIGWGWRKYRAVVLWSVGWIILVHVVYWLPVDWPYLREMALGDPAQRMALLPIIPYTLLGGMGLLWLYERLSATIRDLLRKTVYVQAIIALCLIVIFNYVALPQLQSPLAYTRDDRAAMQWLLENAPDARVLNHPTDEWFMATTGMDAIYGALPARTRTVQGRFDEAFQPEHFWQTPDQNAHFLQLYNIDYIIVPQWASQPAPVPQAIHAQLSGGEADLANLSLLEVAFVQNGAVVYRVLHEKDES